MRFFFISIALTSLLLSGCSTSNNGKKLSDTIAYPDRAWEANVNGSVTATFDVDDSGRARDIKIIDSHPKYMFDREVKEAIKRWQFEKGKPEKGKEITVKFSK